MPKSNPSKLDNLNNISKRLKYIVDTLGVKQSHMAEKLGLSPAGLHYILNNDVRFSKNAKKIADYLNLNEQWLINGEGEIYSENTSIKTYKVPVYYPDQIKIYYNSSGRKGLNTKNFVVTTAPYQNEAFGVYITETDFSPKFEIGDIILLEKTQNFKDGEILLAYLKSQQNFVLKYGFHLNNDIVLLSIGSEPIKLQSEEQNVIIGIYRECRKMVSY